MRAVPIACLLHRDPRAQEDILATARRDKLFGQWAAGKLGYSGDAATKYASEVVDSNFEKPGDDDMLGVISISTTPTR